MTEPSARPGRLHYELLRGLVEACSIPSHDELQALLSCSSAELDRAFEELAEIHGVVLHPASHHVWSIHPFSLAPTPFLVESGRKTWWGNCAWCSLGITVLVGEPCVITTTLGAETEQVQLKWAVRHRIPQGDIQPVAKVLELSKRWYGEHLRPDWTKKSIEEARAIFADLGFAHPVWNLPPNKGRF